jgi:hypothetical protein
LNSPPSFTPLPLIPEIVSTDIIFQFTYMHTVFAQYSPSYNISLPPAPFHWHQTPQAEPAPPTLLFFDFV